jgi:hypothetical protein
MCGKRTRSEIIAEVTGLADRRDSEHSEEEAENKSAPPSFSDAISALATLQGYLCALQMSEADEGCLRRIERLLYEAGETRWKQTILDSSLYLTDKFM